MTAIPKGEWEWFGLSGHFIMGRRCEFHMATKVGTVLVSTVGRLFHDAPVRELLAESRGFTLQGRGDAREADYMKKIGYEEIGLGRKFETMAFRVKGICPCGCGQPEVEDWSELAANGYNDMEEARLGHLEMCRQWAEDQQDGGRER